MISRGFISWLSWLMRLTVFSRAQEHAFREVSVPAFDLYLFIFTPFVGRNIPYKSWMQVHC